MPASQRSLSIALLVRRPAAHPERLERLAERPRPVLVAARSANARGISLPGGTQLLAGHRSPAPPVSSRVARRVAAIHPLRSLALLARWISERSSDGSL